MMKKLELNKTKKIINQLEYFELLDLGEILWMKKQYLERSKTGCFLTNQEIETIEKELESIRIKIVFLIEKLRKFQMDKIWIE